MRRYSYLTEPERLVFTTERGSMIDEHNFVRREWRAACKAAGVDARPYDARHSFVSNAVHAGVDLATIAELSGHSVETLAPVYLHYSRDAGRRAAERLDQAYAGAAS